MTTPVDTGARVRALVSSASSALGSEAEGRFVVAHALRVRPSALALHLHDEAPDAARRCVDEAVGRRRAGEPLQYVLGTWDFRTLELAVDRRVLVPRPETEQVVDLALQELRRADARGPGAAVVAVDLGSGSGAIALSLAAEWAGGASGSGDLQVWATDSSAAALQVLAQNLAALGAAHPHAAARVCVGHGSWFAALPASLAGRVQLVVSNPPYVADSEWAELDPVVRDHEPRAALVAGPEGTEALVRILEDAPGWLAPEGAVVLELAPAQADALAARARRLGYLDVAVRPDLAGRPRALVARVGVGGR